MRSLLTIIALEQEAELKRLGWRQEELCSSWWLKDGKRQHWSDAVCTELKKVAAARDPGS
jgi:hypothetical protein